MRCAIREKKYLCGNYAEVLICPVIKQPRGRKNKYNPTSEVQEKLNQKNAERKIHRLVNANFTIEDYKGELTYNDAHHPDSIERALKDFQNFVKRVNRYRHKRGLDNMKYIMTIEIGSRKGRIHIHFIMSGGLTLSELARLWGMGYLRDFAPLQFDEHGVAGIAKYCAKQMLLGKRWCASRNLVKPEEPPPNHSKYTRRKADRLAQAIEQDNYKEEIKKLYPDWGVASAEVSKNQVNGYDYITIYLYNPEIMKIWRTPKRNGQEIKPKAP